MEKTIKYLVIIYLFLLTLFNTKIYATDVTAYLILNDIAPYQRITQVKDIYTKQYKTILGYWINNNAGVLAGADHFQFDHDDVSYSTKYQSKSIGLGMTVEVTQHTGGDSDRWLLHEIEDAFRDGDNKDGRIGLFSGAGVKIREVDGNKIIYWGLGGGNFRWLNNNIVIDIEYTDLQRTKPEPTEVVKAYLAKYPSTITTIDAEFKSTAYNIKWIKDEIDRRLWLCDKWNAQFQASKTTQKDLLYNLVSNMEVFLNYRERYFADIKAVDEISALYELQKNKDVTSIQTKLTEYKTWWNANKGKSISLP